MEVSLRTISISSIMPSQSQDATASNTTVNWVESVKTQELNDKRDRPWAKALEGLIDNTMSEADEQDVLADGAICENISLAA
jgi:hypothetical protein